MKRILLVVGFTFLFSGCLLRSSENLYTGQNYYINKDFKNAEIYFLKAVNENKDYEAYFFLGLLYEVQEKDELTEKYYKLAIEQGNFHAMNKLGFLYYKQKRTDLAEKYYLMAYDHGHFPLSLLNLGFLYRDNNKYELSEKYFKLALELGL